MNPIVLSFSLCTGSWKKRHPTSIIAELANKVGNMTQAKQAAKLIIKHIYIYILIKEETTTQGKKRAHLEHRTYRRGSY
jgi:hypothetical protein